MNESGDKGRLPVVRVRTAASLSWSFGMAVVRGTRRRGVPDLAYRIDYSPATDEHLRVLTARQRTVVFDGVDEQLEHEPGVETRNRRPMRPDPLAP